jgi:hypothetical protein
MRVRSQNPIPIASRVAVGENAGGTFSHDWRKWMNQPKKCHGQTAAVVGIPLLLSAFYVGVLRNPLWAEDGPSADSQLAKEPENPPRKIRSSDKAVVKDVVYGLEEQENRLTLTSQPLNGADRELKRVPVKFLTATNEQVVDLSLAKLGNKNLMAVVKSRRGDEYRYYCLTFIGPGGESHVRDRFGYHCVEFLTTPDNLQILAMNGSGFSGSVFITLGTMDWDENGRMVTAGTFFFSGCPWPPIGELSPFRAKSIPFGDKPR